MAALLDYAPVVHDQMVSARIVESRWAMTKLVRSFISLAMASYQHFAGID